MSEKSHKASHDANVSDKTQLDSAINEISILRDKLDTKSCALIILSQELIECKAQRDQYKLMGEQLRERYSVLKRKMDGLGPTLSGVYEHEYDSVQSEPLAQLLITLKEQNKHLIREIDDLRMKLEDAEGDLKIVRGQMRSMSQHIDSAAYESRDRNIDINNIISELEFYKNKVILLERDLQSVLDEKEELVLSRDSYKLKVDRLNEKLNSFMRSVSSNASHDSDDHRVVDIDSLFMENRFLKEKLGSFEEEKKMINMRLSKYKEILEKKRIDSTKSILSSSTKESLSSSHMHNTGNVISARQVEQLIATDALNNMEVSANNLSQLRNLVIALFDGLQDKSLSLAHAKKTNKILGKRVDELETQVKCMRNKEKIQVIKQSNSFDSSSSGSVNTISNQEDVEATTDDLNDDEVVVVGPVVATNTTVTNCVTNNSDVDDDDDDDTLPPELDKLVKEAINELKQKELSESSSNFQTCN